MSQRILIGLVKGLTLGVLLGSLFHFGLGWRVTPGLLGYLIAMGVGATAGILAGRPPWLHEAWIESLLKGVFGLAVGAAVYWVAVRFLTFEMAFDVFGAPASSPWTSLPLLYAPPIAMLFALIVELDNGASSKPGAGKPGMPKPGAGKPGAAKPKPAGGGAG
ncbi:MAG: hypothetical protein R3B40_18925 [Polyangiales bacterium]|nr:hypothetical protein [Myxococcales bacterium]MCB9657797.1 hypothetical protein [Sandaracinaceae bacterium]